MRYALTDKEWSIIHGSAALPCLARQPQKLGQRVNKRADCLMTGINRLS